jgi:hypothetical protein
MTPKDVESMMMQQAAILTHAAGGSITVTKEMLEVGPTLQLHKEINREGNVTFRTEIEQ